MILKVMGDRRIASAKTARIIIIEPIIKHFLTYAFPADSVLLHSSFIGLHFSMIWGNTSDIRSKTPFSLMANNWTSSFDTTRKAIGWTQAPPPPLPEPWSPALSFPSPPPLPNPKLTLVTGMIVRPSIIMCSLFTDNGLCRDHICDLFGDDLQGFFQIHIIHSPEFILFLILLKANREESDHKPLYRSYSPSRTILNIFFGIVLK